MSYRADRPSGLGPKGGAVSEAEQISVLGSKTSFFETGTPNKTGSDACSCRTSAGPSGYPNHEEAANRPQDHRPLLGRWRDEQRVPAPLQPRFLIQGS